MRSVVSDTSPLLYLHLVGRLDLLRQLYGTIIVPPAVVAELDDGTRLGYDVPTSTRVPWCRIQAPSGAAFERVSERLGPGERAALALALELPDSLVLLDDRAARLQAEALQLQLTGTLGVLLRAKRDGHLEAVAPLLDVLGARGFRIGVEARRAVLEAAGEA